MILFHSVLEIKRQKLQRPLQIDAQSKIMPMSLHFGVQLA